MKKSFQRTCMGCNAKKDKSKLIRIARNENDIFVDKKGKLEGRGAYICYNIECLERVRKTKRLERVLKTNLSEQIYNDIRGVIIEKSIKNETN